MSKRIVIIEGHPDPAPVRFNAALADAYAQGAREGGHDVRRIKVGAFEFPVLRTAKEWMTGEPTPSIAQAQADIKWAEHLVIIYPLWLGDVPALLKAFLEQVARPGFAFVPEARGFPKGALGGRSARVIVTMGMPEFVYRWYFQAHSLKNLKYNILNFVGIKPVRSTLIGMAEASSKVRDRDLARVRVLGRRGG